jgi:hypothetical protein
MTHIPKFDELNLPIVQPLVRQLPYDSDKHIKYDEQDHFKDWRERVRKRLPELGMRIFAFHGEHYSGCGFEWALHRDYGHLLKVINNYNSRIEFPDTLIIQVIAKSLFKKVSIIEREIQATKAKQKRLK